MAGDVLDAPGFLGWLAEYRRGLSESPAVWGLHNYYDTTYGSSTGVDALLGAVTGAVWLTETGGIVSHRHGDGRSNLPANAERAADGIRRAIALADARAERVRRVYVYQWRAAPGASFDAGLLTPGGSRRPGYDALRRALRERAPAAPPTVAARAGAPRIAATGRATLSGRRVTLPFVCVAPHGARCAGRLSIESATWRTAPLINGRASGRLLAPRSRHVALPAARTSPVSLGLGRRPSRKAQLRLRVSLVEPDGTTVLLVPLLRIR